jgi:hypothetical protein
VSFLTPVWNCVDTFVHPSAQREVLSSSHRDLARAERSSRRPNYRIQSDQKIA